MYLRFDYLYQRLNSDSENDAVILTPCRAGEVMMGERVQLIQLETLATIAP